MFYFAFEVRPTAAIPQAAEIAGATAHMFVNHTARDAAEAHARAYLLDLGWLIVDMELVRQIPPEQVHALDTAAQASYRRAQHDGVHVVLCAWPMQDRPEDQVEIQPLPSPSSPPKAH